MAAQLILASTSAYRRELLSRLQLPFDTASPAVDEALRAGEEPRDRAVRLAAEKATAVSRQVPAATVIGGDQVAALDGAVLRKPGTVERAREQLAASSGRVVTFYTAVALATGGEAPVTECVDVRVAFRRLTALEIDRYLAAEPAVDCAGSFRWESLGITLFEHIDSRDPTALTGLPLITLSKMLRESGFDI